MLLYLPDLQERWIDLFWEMSKNPLVDKRYLAAPFLSVEPDGYDPDNHKTILYVGKATHRDWFLSEFLAMPTRNARRAMTKKFLRESVATGEYGGAFWNFAKRLNDLTPTGRDRPFKNIVWSNIAKIGTTEGDPPSGQYLALQADLAKQTLIGEIESYRPSLIVFVTKGYARQIVWDVFRHFEAGQDDISWQKPRPDVWWRARDAKLRAALCLYHPGRKPSRQIEEWARYASDLLGR